MDILKSYIIDRSFTGEINKIEQGFSYYTANLLWNLNCTIELTKDNLKTYFNIDFNDYTRELNNCEIRFDNKNNMVIFFDYDEARKAIKIIKNLIKNGDDTFYNIFRNNSFSLTLNMLSLSNQTKSKNLNLTNQIYEDVNIIDLNNYSALIDLDDIIDNYDADF